MNLERWGWYSIGVNVFLAAVNLVIAAASGSLAVKAELIHNLIDLVTAVAVLLGLKLSTRKTRSFPYGLYKIENVVAAGLAMFIFLTGYEIARHALFGAPAPVRVNVWILAGLCVALVVPLVFSQLEMRVGKQANSPVLMADAREYRVHVLTTGVVLAALVGQWFAIPLDRFAALIVVVAIAKTGWDLLSDSMRVLLDASLDPDTILKIRELILSEPAVSEVRWVTGRNAGRFRFVETEIALRVRDLEKVEAVTRRIEERIGNEVSNVERVLIHPEPVQRTHLRCAVPLADTRGTVSEHFGDAPYFALVLIHVHKKQVEEQRIMSNPHQDEDKAKGIRVAEWLVDKKTDVVLSRKSLEGRGPVYVFGEAAVDLRVSDSETLSEALNEVMEAI